MADRILFSYDNHYRLWEKIICWHNRQTCRVNNQSPGTRPLSAWSPDFSYVRFQVLFPLMKQICFSPSCRHQGWSGLEDLKKRFWRTHLQDSLAGIARWRINTRWSGQEKHSTAVFTVELWYTRRIGLTYNFVFTCTVFHRALSSNGGTFRRRYLQLYCIGFIMDKNELIETINYSAIKTKKG